MMAITTSSVALGVIVEICLIKIEQHGYLAAKKSTMRLLSLAIDIALSIFCMWTRK